MKKLGIYILVCLLIVGVITPAQAETALTWDVKGTGTNPYTLTFTGAGVVHLESETELVFEEGGTGRDIDIAQTPVVTFTATTAPVVKIVSADQTKTVLIEFGREIKEESVEEPLAEDPPAEKPVKEESIKGELVKAKQAAPKKQSVATTGTINGIIWYDENEDGIRQDEETYLNDVPVYLLNEDYDVVNEVYTQDGRYTFKDLPPGTYYVEVYGMDIGYYYTSPQHEGMDPEIDSDLDEEDMAEVNLKAGETVQIDAGLSGQDEEESDFTSLLIVTNFLDANADKRPDDSEQTIPATYTVTDASTGDDIYTEKVGQEDALMMELSPGTYTVKTEVAAGYTVEGMHRISLDEWAGFFEMAEADMKSLAVGIADENETGLKDFDAFLNLLERKATTDSITMTEDTLGYFLVAEVVKVKVAATPEPKPKPKQTPTSVKAVEPQAADVTAQPAPTAAPIEQLPQAGEDKPFPYAVAGASLAVAGLWLLLRRAG